MLLNPVQLNMLQGEFTIAICSVCLYTFSTLVSEKVLDVILKSAQQPCDIQAPILDVLKTFYFSL